MTHRTRIVVATVALVLAALLLLLLPRSAAAADPGQLAFNNFCRTCHSVREGDHRIGPSLHGVFGRKAGTAPGYGAYSYALAQSGVVWDAKTLDQFIEDPEKVVRNNNMKPYAGLTDPEVRQQIVEYLKTLSDGGEAAESPATRQ